MATSAKKAPDGGADDWQEAPKASAKEVDDWQEGPKNPSDERASLLSRIPGMALRAIPGVGDAAKIMDAAGGSSDALARAAVDKMSLGNLGYSKDWRDQLARDSAQYPKSSATGAFEGYGGLAAAGGLLPGGLIAQAGAQGLLTRPEGEPLSAAEDAKRRGIQGMIGAGTGTALSMMGGAAGQAGDWAMQKATGMSKYIPGMGTRLANEGLMGTQGFMQKQINGPGEGPGFIDRMLQKIGVTGKMGAREAQIQKALPQVQGQVSPIPSSNAIDQIGASYVPKNPNIPIPSANQQFVQAAKDRSLEAIARGQLSPADALDVARTVDKAAYDTSVPMGRFQRQLGKADSGALRSTVKDMANSQGVNDVANGLSSEQALINARDAMNEPVSLRDNLIRHGRRGIIGGGIGALMGHGYPGMVAGMAAAEGLSTPLALSTMGQIGTKASQAIPYASPAFVDEMVRRAKENQ